MVSAARKIFLVEETTVSGIENMVRMMQTIFTTSGTAVRTAQKIGSFAQTLVSILQNPQPIARNPPKNRNLTKTTMTHPDSR